MGNLNLWQRKPSNFKTFFNDPWELFSAFESDLTPMLRDPNKGAGFAVPPCDISETESAYVLSFDIPGLKKEEIEIDIKGNQLTVSGERKSKQETKTEGVHRIERTFGRFQRSFTLPEGTDSNKIEAHYDTGVLEVGIPKATSTQATKVQVGDGEGGLMMKKNNKY